MNFSVEIGKQQEKALRESLFKIRDGADVALMRAINQGVKGGKTDASKLIRAEVTMKKMDVDADIDTDFASKSKLSGKIEFKSKPIPLAKFTHSETYKGVSVKVWKSGNKKLFPHTFKAKMGKHEGIYMRKNMVGEGKLTPAQASKKIGFFASLPYKHRMKSPLIELKGPTIHYLYTESKQKIGKAIEINAQQRFFDEFDRQLALLLKAAA